VEGRIEALAGHGTINPGSLWVNVGAHAINGWVAMRAHDLIAAKADAAAASKALAKAEADLAVLTKADVVAAKTGDMSGADITAAIHAVFVAVPEQPCTRSSLSSKAQGLAFLTALSAPWANLLAPARGACTAAIAAATAAVAAASAAAVAAVADNQPPAAPSVVAAGAVTAADVDVGAMSAAEKRTLLARLLGPGGMGDE
jgi:hypothetical protein